MHKIFYTLLNWFVIWSMYNFLGQDTQERDWIHGVWAWRSTPSMMPNTNNPMEDNLIWV